MSENELDADVVISGGGPCGLVLALELGRRNISTIVLNDRPTTSPYPQAGATQARTMEHYRRLGISDKVRAAGLPSDWPTDVAYFTRYSTDEISRFEMPSSGAAENLVRGMSGSWSAAELPHRISQMLVEEILFEEVSKLPSVTLNFGWKVTDFTDNGSHVDVVAVSDAGIERSFSGRYMVGADAARGPTRRILDVKYEGDNVTDRPFLSGQMLSVFFRSKSFYSNIPHRKAWQYWAVNPARRGMTISLNGEDQFVFVTQLRPGEDVQAMSEEDVRNLIHIVMGQDYDVEIISRAPWTAGLALVAEKFRKGRVFLGGDAAHLFTPTGGLGYNTAVDDAVNLGWKLAAVIKGWGGDELIGSYDLERQPLARRNTGYARMFADSIGRFIVPDHIEEDSARGAEARKESGEYLLGHAKREFNIPGVTFGGRYDGSPLIVSDDTVPPPDSPSEYVPTACPGGRAPHAWLSDGRSLFDALGFEFSLLCLAGENEDARTFAGLAERLAIPLTIVDVGAENLRDLYGADFALIRPDQIVCWRGDHFPADPAALIGQITGHGTLAAEAAAVSDGVTGMT